MKALITAVATAALLANHFLIPSLYATSRRPYASNPPVAVQLTAPPYSVPTT